MEVFALIRAVCLSQEVYNSKFSASYGENAVSGLRHRPVSGVEKASKYSVYAGSFRYVRS
jgi:hypothetical protein